MRSQLVRASQRRMPVACVQSVQKNETQPAPAMTVWRLLAEAAQALVAPAELPLFHNAFPFEIPAKTPVGADTLFTPLLHLSRDPRKQSIKQHQPGL